MAIPPSNNFGTARRCIDFVRATTFRGEAAFGPNSPNRCQDPERARAVPGLESRLPGDSLEKTDSRDAASAGLRRPAGERGYPSYSNAWFGRGGEGACGGERPGRIEGGAGCRTWFRAMSRFFLSICEMTSCFGVEILSSTPRRLSAAPRVRTPAVMVAAPRTGPRITRVTTLSCSVAVPSSQWFTWATPFCCF